jgi:hypothetical protein
LWEKKTSKNNILTSIIKWEKKTKTKKTTKQTKHAVGTVPRFTRILLKVF